MDPRLNQIVLPFLVVVQDDGLRTLLVAHIQEHQARINQQRRESDEGLIARALLTTLRRNKGPTTVQVRA